MRLVGCSTKRGSTWIIWSLKYPALYKNCIVEQSKQWTTPAKYKLIYDRLSIAMAEVLVSGIVLKPSTSNLDIAAKLVFTSQLKDTKLCTALPLT